MFPQVLACDVTGHPHDWMNWDDAITAKVKGTIAYEHGDSTLLARGGVSRMTGVQSQVNVASIVYLKGQYYKKDRVTLTNPNLFRRDLNTCAYCGRVYSEAKLSRDHVIPTSKGGKDVWKNVVTSCKSCNCEKDDMSLEEAGMELLYVPYVPSRIEELILKNRKILACQMEFLQAYLPEHSRLLTGKL